MTDKPAYLSKEELKKDDIKVLTGQKIVYMNGDVRETRVVDLKVLSGKVMLDIQAECGTEITKEKMDDGKILWSVVKPQLDKGDINNMKVNKSSGLYDALVRRIDEISGIPMDEAIKSLKNVGGAT